MIIKKGTITSNYIKIYDLQTKKIGIPIFQRFYAWREKEIEQFKDDLLCIINEDKSQFYLLDFIYYEEDGYIKLADGQQRIVTLNNLIKAIKAVAEEESIDIDEINRFDIKYDVFANQKKYETHFNNYPISPFKKVYLDLYSFVKMNKERLNDLVSVIKNKIYVFIKKCNNADDAFNIFQQINTGGKPLTKDEVIKTALDQYAKAYQLEFNTSKIREVRQAITSFYKFVSSNYDKNFDNMEIITFLKENVTKDKKTYQDFIQKVSLLKNVENCPIKYVINYINRNTLLDILNILAMKKIDINTDYNYLRYVMVPLCMMSIILTLNGGSPTTFRYLLNDVTERIKKSQKPMKIFESMVGRINKDETTWTMSLIDFSNKMGDPTTKRNIKKALLILDVICSNTSGTLNVKSINLEHIYPQEPDYLWAVNEWNPHKEEFASLKDNIGNYLLLCEAVNKKIQNKYISEKVKYYNEIIERDKILQTKTNTVDFVRFEKEKGSYIRERQEEIAKLMRENLPLGKILIKSEETKEE